MKQLLIFAAVDPEQKKTLKDLRECEKERRATSAGYRGTPHTKLQNEPFHLSRNYRGSLSTLSKKVILDMKKCSKPF